MFVKICKFLLKNTVFFAIFFFFFFFFFFLRKFVHFCENLQNCAKICKFLRKIIDFYENLLIFAR